LNDIIIHFTEFSNKCQTNPVCFRKFSEKIYLDQFTLYLQLKNIKLIYKIINV